ncbi:MAG: SLC13 family permease, partial [Oxalobacter sp.]
MIRRGFNPLSGRIGRFFRNIRYSALVIGPLVAIAVYFMLPDTYTNAVGETLPFSHAAKACLAVVVLMGIYWFTEAIPIAATAIIPVAIFPILGIASLKDTCIPYGSSTIFLFLGGFLLAAGIQRWNLDRRLALYTIRIMGTKPQQISAGMMIATALLAMWVSNTATAAMMVPIVSAVLRLFQTECHGGTRSNRKEHNFAICMLLCVAYGANIG